QPWSVPTGSSSNSNSGWFGANTSDSRVSGWSGASAKFGPISPVEHPVDYSSSSDRSGTVVVVTYGLEVNALQPSDIYSGILVYNVEATY
ncbi:hypothetical protein KGQ71_04830, partial [Patescibacteria group bacterium]|nr:hypothetical protein [Patescibacteria group bacterium]